MKKAERALLKISQTTFIQLWTGGLMRVNDLLYEN